MKVRRHPVIKPTVAQLLDFAAAHPGKITGAVDELLRRDLGIPAIRYQQLLTQAIQTQEALAYDPLTTRRLIREAARRASTREARTGH